MKKLKHKEIPFAPIFKTHKIPLHVKLEPSKFSEGMKAVSISSIGMVISQALKRDIPAPISIIMVGLPLSLSLINMVNKSNHQTADKLNCYGH